MKAINSDPYAGILTKLTAPFFILIAFSISAPALMAGNSFFTNSIGDFDSASNWQGGLPGGFGNTFIGSSDLGDVRPLPATVNLNTDVTSLATGALFLGQGGSGNGILNINSGGSLQYGLVYIGRDGGAVGVLNQTGGTMRVNTGEFEILSGSSGSGTYNLSGGVLNTIQAGAISIKVGAAGSGTGYFNMSGGTLNAGSAPHEHSMNVGWGARGEATFSGGTANLTGDLNAGNGSNGLVTISGSAMVNSKSVNVGLNAGAANSRLTVTGGTLAVTNGIRVANTSALNISGGTITATGIEIASGSVMTNTGGTLNISTITNNGGVTFNRTDTLTFEGAISGSGTTYIDGSTLALGSGGSLATTTTVNSGGTLALQSGSSWHNGEISINSGGTMRFAGGSGTSSKSLHAYGGTVDVNGQSLAEGTFANFIAQSTGAKLMNSSSSAASIAAGNTIWLLGSSAEIQTVGNLQINSAITSALASSSNGITKTGAGTLILAGANSFTGTTTVNAGTLKVASGGSISSSATTINSGGTLDVAGTAGSVTVNNQGTLKGSGTVSALTIASGGTLAPGNSTGILNAGSTTFASGGNYKWEIDTFGGVVGNNWDFLNITGDLTISATSGSKFIIDVISLLSSTDTAGLASNFNDGTNYTFAIATASGTISGYAANAFSINTAAFQNPFTGTWGTSLSNDGKSLNITYTAATAIPEPSTGILFLSALGILALRQRGRGTPSR